jgi:hypothetical protein
MITWSINGLKVQQGPNDLLNVVNEAHWTASLTEGSDTVYSYGSVPLVYGEENAFVPFAELSEATVVSWVKQVLGQDTVSEIEARLTAEMQNSISNKTDPSLPWA